MSPITNPQLELFQERAAVYSNYYSSKPSSVTFSFRKRMELSCGLAERFQGRLLDCATGTGEITTAILRSGRFPAATVLDLSSNMLDQSRQRIEAAGVESLIEYVNQDVFLFGPQGCGKFDLILCLGLIAHTGRLEQLLGHLKSMLSQTGGILLQSSLCEHWGNRIVRSVSAGRYARKFGYEIAYFNDRDIRDAAAGAELNVDESRRFCLGLPFGDRVWARGAHWLETHCQGWAAHRGGEALYLLRR